MSAAGPKRPRTKSRAPRAETILSLGDPRLREMAEPVASASPADVAAAAKALARTLDAFHQEQGFGRAMAAPQIGVRLRMIAFHLPELESGEAPRPAGSFVALDPEIIWTSADTFSMWDDCMSFPYLLVRVRRHASVSFRYADVEGNVVEWPELSRSMSELVQHEIDHLEGVLAVDRAVDRFSLVGRGEFERTPHLFRGQVDYVIGE